MNGLHLEHLTDRELLLLTAQTVNELKRELIAQSCRLRTLETWRWMLSGGLVVVGVMGGYILTRLP